MAWPQPAPSRLVAVAIATAVVTVGAARAALDTWDIRARPSASAMPSGPHHRTVLDNDRQVVGWSDDAELPVELALPDGTSVAAEHRADLIEWAMRTWETEPG